MTLHEPQVPVNCDVCGILLSNERNYLIHKKIQHPEGGAQEHHCNICGKIYPTRRALSRHVNKLHKKGLDQKCTMCEKAFKYATALRVRNVYGIKYTFLLLFLTIIVFYLRNIWLHILAKLYIHVPIVQKRIIHVRIYLNIVRICMQKNGLLINIKSIMERNLCLIQMNHKHLNK